MKTIIYMVRHAESPYDEGDERTRGLTAKGKVDAEKVTKLLLDEGIHLVISSPYSRAVQSVAGLAQHEITSTTGNMSYQAESLMQFARIGQLQCSRPY